MAYDFCFITPNFLLSTLCLLEHQSWYGVLTMATLGHFGLFHVQMPADALDAGEITQVIGVKSNHVPFVGFLWTSSMELKRIVLSP